MNGIDGGLNDAGMDAGVTGGANDVGSPVVPCDAGLAGGVPPPPVVTPFINADPIVLVKKPYTSPARKLVRLSVDDPGFDGTGVFTSSSNAIRFYTTPTGTAEITSGHVYPGPQLGPGITLYAEGVTPSAAMNDVQLTLSLNPGSKPVNPPAHATMTAVEVWLDIHKSRTARGLSPVALTVAQKTSNPGRIVHVQNTSYHHGRALLIVRKAAPAAFAGTLTLAPENATARVFADPAEVAASGQAPLTNPHPIPNAGIPATGQRFWAEGANVSGGVGDTGFRLGVQGLDPDGDHVKMTVVQFSHLTATVSSTPPNPPPHMGNGPVPDHAPFAGGNAASDYDESFTTNRPLVLLENSLGAGKRVSLSVRIRPRVPVFWSVQRNRAPAPDGDHHDIISISPHSEPTIAPLRTDTLNATMQLDAVGSFHIRPFVDCDGGGNFEYNDAAGNRIDREPFVIMNLVLVRAQGYQNNSVRNVGPIPTNPPIPTAATGVGITTGAWTAATAAVHNDAIITLIGGGGNGRLGLDCVFAGWVNNITAGDILRDYLDTTVMPNPHHIERLRFTSNSPSIHTPYRLGIFYNAALPPPAAVLGPSSAAAPAPLRLPVLDVTPFGSEGTGGNTCVGTEGAVGPPSPIGQTRLPTAGHALGYGEDWRVEQFDSPSLGAGSSPIMYPGNLVEFRFNLDFRCDLCVWTNMARVPGATPDPANRLYATVQTDLWTIRFRVTFNPPGAALPGVARIVTPCVIGITKDANPTRQARPVEGSGLEVRFPIALMCYAVDATS